MQVAGSDENTYTEALSTWQGLGDAAREKVDLVDVHGYEYTNGRRDLLYEAVHHDGKRLWNSEYGEGDASGMSLAQNLNLDFQYLHPTAWVYWQVLDGAGWGLIEASNEDGTVGLPHPKYYVLLQYSRHIRPGMLIIDGGDANTVSAYDKQRGVLVIVTTNYGNAQWITYDLSKFSDVAGPVTRWKTLAGDSGDKYKIYHDVSIQGERLVNVFFESNSVQTFEIQNVKI